ncbi:MAG TPA: pyridoxamine 5'-phosphate oxidase family protein [bacterium]|nr:pyridoxamine 5'-phosphate oxidase family protein [bacterium]
MDCSMMDEKLISSSLDIYTPKFLATADRDGVPNVVPVISIEAWDAGTLIFGELMILKTKKNLEENPRVGIAVITKELNSWVLKGEFEGFERTGEKYDRIGMRDMYRYNAYTGLRNVGTIRVTQSKRVKGMLSPARVVETGTGAISSNRVKFGHTGPMPPQVTEKFSRLNAAKVISYVDSDGHPVAVPAVSLFPVSHGELLVGRGALKDLEGRLPELPMRVAASVITDDPVAYQIKGTLKGYERKGAAKFARLIVDEVYSASPPVPGERIDRVLLS